MARQPLGPRRHCRFLYGAHAGGPSGRGGTLGRAGMAARRSGVDGHGHLGDALHRHARLFRAGSAALQHPDHAGVAADCDPDLGLCAVDRKPQGPDGRSSRGQLSGHGCRHRRHALHGNGGDPNSTGDHLQSGVGCGVGAHRDHSVVCRVMALLPAADPGSSFREDGARFVGGHHGLRNSGHALHRDDRGAVCAGLIFPWGSGVQQ